ncbi:hypothetical protein PR048_010873 [Dryococelus australis]|uniref:Parvovirus non-structural protein 1 helicase domain-containing protein n=1 Tax=Dryococelus australis TaxID=614101 RepID=A0ABQ9I3Z6_9NEOP|nr:hypothetical protein PR048_010873 [Dryococelus australis]
MCHNTPTLRKHLRNSLLRTTLTPKVIVIARSKGIPLIIIYIPAHQERLFIMYTYCTQHGRCDHNEYYCQCFTCGPCGQCPFAQEFRTTDLDDLTAEDYCQVDEIIVTAPGKELSQDTTQIQTTIETGFKFHGVGGTSSEHRGSSLSGEHEGNQIQSTTAQIHSPPTNTTNKAGTSKSTTPKSRATNNTSPPIHGKGTSKQHSISPSNPSKRRLFERVLSESNKHKQQRGKRSNSKNNIRSLNSMDANNPLYSAIKRARTVDSSGDDGQESDHPDIAFPDQQNTHRATSPTRRISTVDLTDDGELDTHDNGPQPSTSNGNRNGDRTADGHTHDYYTFVVHCNSSEWQSIKSTNTSNRKQPSFIIFKHTDHVHIIYTAKFNNQSRTLTRIVKALNLSGARTTEANSSIQRIRNIARFVAYCIRKGLAMLHKFGICTGPIKSLLEMLYNIDQTDAPIETICEPYVEAKKRANNEYTDNYQNYRNNIVDTLNAAVNKYDFESYEKFISKISYAEKIQFLKICGTSLPSYTRQIIKYRNCEKNIAIKNTNYCEHIKHETLSARQLEHIEWLHTFFTKNNTDIPKFYSDFIIIQTMMLKNVNGLVILGPTNTGKSMIVRLLTEPLNPTLISRERDRSSFHLDQLPNATSVLFEEPCIDNTSVGNWKLLLEGTKTNTDMKHQDKEIIERIPIFITTNQELWAWCESGCRNRNMHLVGLLLSQQIQRLLKKKNVDSSSDGTPTSAGQTAQQGQDGYGYNMHETVPSNYFSRVQQVIHGSLPLSYWWDADFSQDPRVIIIPYRSLGFWTGTFGLKPTDELHNYPKAFADLMNMSTLIQIHALKFSIHNQATTRQRLLTQGSTSTTTWDFESSQNLIIGKADRTSMELTISELEVRPPFRRTPMDIMANYDTQDPLTYEELAVGHTKEFNIPFNNMPHIIPDNQKKRSLFWQGCIPGASGTTWMINDKQNYSETWDLLNKGAIRSNFTFPAIFLSAPEIPAESGAMKFRFRLRVQTLMDYTLVTEPFSKRELQGRDYCVLPQGQMTKDRECKMFYPGHDMKNII